MAKIRVYMEFELPEGVDLQYGHDANGVVDEFVREDIVESLVGHHLANKNRVWRRLATCDWGWKVAGCSQSHSR